GRQIDWVIVRENSEGEYAGVGGRADGGLPLETGLGVAVFTRKGVERICRFACELAMSRPRKRLAVVTKHNAERHGRGLWAGVGGRVHGGLPLATVLDVAVFTRKGVERICRFACELALGRPRKRLAVVTKSNAPRDGMVSWDAVCRAVLADYPGRDVDFNQV